MQEFVERIGIDRTVVNNIQILDVDTEKLLGHPNVAFEREGEFRYCTVSGVEFKWLKIADNKMFGALTAGIRRINYKDIRSVHMDIRVNDSLYMNLQNKTVHEYLDYINKICEYAEYEYGVVLDMTDAVLGKMELNYTFVTEKSFSKYRRVWNLITYCMPDKRLKTVDIRRTDAVAGGFSSETFMRGNKSMGIKIYDKTQQLKDKYKMEIPLQFTRVELELKSSAKIRTAIGSNRLDELYDYEDTMKEFFMRQIKRLIVKPMEVWKVQNRKKLDVAVKDAKKTYPRKWFVHVLHMVSDAEQQSTVPVLLGIDDLLSVVKEQVKYGHYGRTRESIIRQCQEHQTYLMGDDKKLQEILYKLKNANQELKILITPIDGETQNVQMAS